MISRTGQYALRAVVYLARHTGEWPVSGRRIAVELNTPRKYLSSILGDLVRSGVLNASPGQPGGFRMTRPPDRVRLRDVLAPFEQVGKSGVRGHDHVEADRVPCAGHARWKRLKEEYGCFLFETMASEVARSSPQCRPARRAGKKDLMLDRGAAGVGDELHESGIR